MPTSKRIGILGSGDVGQSLGRGLKRHGWDVMLGSRTPAKLAAWAKETGGATGTFPDAAKHGEVVIVATMGAAAVDAVRLAGPAAFDGKLVLDATNPLDFSKGMPPGLLFGLDDSLGERIQRALPGAHVVKCFNTVPHVHMVDPSFKEGAPPMMICGDDAAAKKRAEAILRGIGWPGVLDVGGIEAARYLEALVPLWVRAGVALNTFGHAFKVVQ